MEKYFVVAAFGGVYCKCRSGELRARPPLLGGRCRDRYRGRIPGWPPQPQGLRSASAFFSTADPDADPDLKSFSPVKIGETHPNLLLEAALLLW